LKKFLVIIDSLLLFMSNLKSYVLILTATAAISVAQPVMLSYRPVAAEYSTTLDRVITVSGNPNMLHVYDPVSQNDTTVRLVQPPLSLSISPDGLHAAVGHDALVSYVNLATGAVDKTFMVPATADSVVLSGSWIYVLPSRQGSSVSVNLTTGAVTPNNSVFFSEWQRQSPECGRECHLRHARRHLSQRR
jgi:hypothetical protein